MSILVRMMLTIYTKNKLSINLRRDNIVSFLQKLGLIKNKYRNQIELFWHMTQLWCDMCKKIFKNF